MEDPIAAAKAIVAAGMVKGQEEEGVTKARCHPLSFPTVPATGACHASALVPAPLATAVLFLLPPPHQAPGAAAAVLAELREMFAVHGDTMYAAYLPTAAAATTSINTSSATFNTATVATSTTTTTSTSAPHLLRPHAPPPDRYDPVVTQQEHALQVR